jgi:uncharacterized repeat protein (TIGR01451 family)
VERRLPPQDLRKIECVFRPAVSPTVSRRKRSFRNGSYQEGLLETSRTGTESLLEEWQRRDRQMRTSLTTTVLLVILVVGAASALAGPNLAGTMEAHKIIIGEQNREIAVSADQVKPQDKIEYTLRYRNVGDASASGVSLVGPIPAGTVYLDKTATEKDAMRPLFSIDGGESFHEAPVMYVVKDANGVEQRKAATADMYTHVMWNVATALDVGGEVAVSYRVQVK